MITKCFSTLLCCEWAYGFTTLTLLQFCAGRGWILGNLGGWSSPSDVVRSWLRLQTNTDRQLTYISYVSKMFYSIFAMLWMGIYGPPLNCLHFLCRWRFNLGSIAMMWWHIGPPCIDSWRCHTTDCDHFLGATFSRMHCRLWGCFRGCDWFLHSSFFCWLLYSLLAIPHPDLLLFFLPYSPSLVIVVNLASSFHLLADCCFFCYHHRHPPLPFLVSVPRQELIIYFPISVPFSVSVPHQKLMIKFLISLPFLVSGRNATGHGFSPRDRFL